MSLLRTFIKEAGMAVAGVVVAELAKEAGKQVPGAINATKNGAKKVGGAVKRKFGKNQPE